MEWGTPVKWDRFLLLCVPQSVKTKETNPTRPGSPTPCKQALRATLTEEDIAYYAEKERRLIENGTPKSTIRLKKCSLEKVFWNDRMVGKQKSSTRALRIHSWQVLSATLGHCYSQYSRCVTELLAD